MIGVYTGEFLLLVLIDKISLSNGTIYIACFCSPHCISLTVMTKLAKLQIQTSL